MPASAQDSAADSGRLAGRIDGPVAVIGDVHGQLDLLDRLVEKLAGEIASLGLGFSGAIERIRVSVEKPGAIRFARSVGVTIERTRGES